MFRFGILVVKFCFDTTFISGALFENLLPKKNEISIHPILYVINSYNSNVIGIVIKILPQHNNPHLIQIN